MSNLLSLIAARKAQVSRVKTLKVNNGRNRFRILPSWRTADKAPAELRQPGNEQALAHWLEQFWLDYGQHFIKGADGTVKAVVVCADKTLGRPCAVCSEIDRGILNTTDDLTKKRLEDARAGSRILLNVLHLDGPNPNEVQVLETAPSVLYGLKGVGGLFGAIPDWPNLLDLQNGADVIVEKSGTGKNDTAYSVSVVPSQLKLNKDILGKLHNLDALAVVGPDSNQRAIASVSAITGLLPAPSRPTLGEAAAQVFDDVPDVVAQSPAPTPAPVAQPTQHTPAPSPAPVAQPTVATGGSDDLEAMLAGLDNM